MIIRQDDLVTVLCSLTLTESIRVNNLKEEIQLALSLDSIPDETITGIAKAMELIEVDIELIDRVLPMIKNTETSKAFNVTREECEDSFRECLELLRKIGIYRYALHTETANNN
jgi:hypothetical protein